MGGLVGGGCWVRRLACGESQVAVRGGELRVARLVRAGSEGVLVSPVGVAEWRLDVTGANTFDGLGLVACPEAARVLGVGEVRVGVRAGGVNFRDVLIALGAYPGEANVSATRVRASCWRSARGWRVGGRGSRDGVVARWVWVRSR